VTMGGSFFKDHREELLQMAKNEEARAKAEHPLKRIMKIEIRRRVQITTTSITSPAASRGAAPYLPGRTGISYNERRTCCGCKAARAGPRPVRQARHSRRGPFRHPITCVCWSGCCRSRTRRLRPTCLQAVYDYWVMPLRT
jgi:hypothetical protein